MSGDHESVWEMVTSGMQSEKTGKTKKTRLYIAGPMQGLPEYNIPLFTRVAGVLRNKGYEVVNPAELSMPEDGYAACMRKAIAGLLTCDAIALLPEWTTSRGACIEAQIATACAMTIYDVRVDDADVSLALNYSHKSVALAASAFGRGETVPRSGSDTPSSILDEARSITLGDRGEAYGPPEQDFRRIGRLWGPLLGLEGDVSPETVGLCLIALKLSREAYKPKRDSRVDMVGYALCLERIHGGS